MKCLHSFNVSFIAMALLLGFLAAPSACADTYLVYDFGVSGGLAPVGLTDDGVAVVSTVENPCHNPTVGPCYEVFVFGQLTETTTVAPVFNYDNGTHCSLTGAQGNGMSNGPVCNNGFETFLGNPSAGFSGTFLGTPSDLQKVDGEGGDFIAKLDSLGDLLEANAQSDHTYEFFDVTSRSGITPEPSSLALLGTGILCVAGAARRRLLIR